MDLEKLLQENKKLKEENTLLKKQLSEIESTAENEYTDSSTHLQLKKKNDLYESLLDNNKYILEKYKKEIVHLQQENAYLKQWQNNPRHGGRPKREHTERGQSIIIQITNMIKQGLKNKEMIDQLYFLGISEATFYRYKKIAIRRMKEKEHGK